MGNLTEQWDRVHVLIGKAASYLYVSLQTLNQNAVGVSLRFKL